jgi:hypothetical protein
LAVAAVHKQLGLFFDLGGIYKTHSVGDLF